MHRRGVVVLALAAATLCGSAQAAEKLSFSLNYIAGGDHAPLYYARQQGWLQQAGFEVEFLQSQGSAAALQMIAAGKSQIGIVDMASVLIARGRGVRSLAVMNIYANSPYGLYWLKSSGITSPKDLSGRKVGTPPGDAARNLWVPLARKVGVDPASVTWVNISAAAKLPALKSGAIDATTTFYTSNYLYRRELGSEFGYAAWSEYGINPYSNSIIVNVDYATKNPDSVKKFIHVLQKAYAACVTKPDPCIAALVDANTALKRDDMLNAWYATVELMAVKEPAGGLGYMKPEQMADDYKLMKEYFGFQSEFPVAEVYSNSFLDPTIKPPK